MPPIARMAMLFIQSGLIFLALMFLGLWFYQSKMIYYPDDRTIFALPTALGMPYEDIHFEAEDGTRLNGWFIPASAQVRDSWTLLLCHGNAGNISHRIHKAAIYHKLGLNVFLFDYRGYGKSTGDPSEKGTYQDAEGAYRYLTTTRHMAPERILFYGESLGTGVATEMAVRHPAAGLILESGFTSVLRMGQRSMPWLRAVPWLVRHRYDNLAKIPRVKMPVLIMHGPEDEVIPYEEGRALFDAAPEPKSFVKLTGSHNNGYLEAGETYSRAIHDFCVRH